MTAKCAPTIRNEAADRGLAGARTVSDHFDGRRFFNPGLRTDRSLIDLLRWWSEPKSPWPARRENRIHPPPRAAGARITATFIGQASFLLQLDGVNILTDPIFSQRASPLGFAGPKRVRDPGIRFDELPPIDLVLLSHNHYDHMDLPSLRRLAERFDPLVLTGLGNAPYLAKRGVANVIDLDWWDAVRFGSGLAITFVPAQHWSKRSLFDRRRTLWGGFVIQGSARVYFAGDTGYPAQFRAIRTRLGAPDLALLPIGAYEPRWFMGLQHMNPDEAVRAHLDLGARVSLAMHFGTFRLTNEAIDAPLEALAQARLTHGVPPDAFRVLDFGESFRSA